LVFDERSVRRTLWRAHEATDVREDPYLPHIFKIDSFTRRYQALIMFVASDTYDVDRSPTMVMMEMMIATMTKDSVMGLMGL